MTITHKFLLKESRKEVEARHCKMGHLYLFDEKDTVGVYTPVNPCDIVREATNDKLAKEKRTGKLRHFVVFHDDSLPTQGSLVSEDQIMIEVGELKISVA